MLALPLATLLIAHFVEILVLLRTITNHLPEILEPAACARAVLTGWDRSRGGVGDEADEVARAVTVDGAAVTCHHLHTDVAEEGDQIGHAPGACPL